MRTPTLTFSVSADPCIPQPTKPQIGKTFSHTKHTQLQGSTLAAVTTLSKSVFQRHAALNQNVVCTITPCNPSSHVLFTRMKTLASKVRTRMSGAICTANPTQIIDPAVDIELKQDFANGCEARPSTARKRQARKPHLQTTGVRKANARLSHPNHSVGDVCFACASAVFPATRSVVIREDHT